MIFLNTFYQSILHFELVGDVYIRLMKLSTNGCRELDVSIFWRVGCIFGEWVFIWFNILLRSVHSDLQSRRKCCGVSGWVLHLWQVGSIWLLVMFRAVRVSFWVKQRRMSWRRKPGRNVTFPPP